MWKLKFWKLDIKFGNWNFRNWELKFENQNFEESFKDGILKINK